MTQELLLAGRVKDIAALIKKYRIPPDANALMLLEIQPDYIVEPGERQELLRFDYFDRVTDFTRYSSGRIFHKQGELRWEKQPSSVQIVYTGNEQYKPELDIRQTMALDTCDLVTRRYFLFGKRLDTEQLKRIGPPARADDFAEVRIPRLLHYSPAPQGAERVHLVVYEYIDRGTGVNVAFRFAELVGAK